MSRFILALSLLILMARGTLDPDGAGSSMDPNGGTHRAVTRNNGSCIDPDGRPCGAGGGSLLADPDKGLGVDPNG